MYTRITNHSFIFYILILCLIQGCCGLKNSTTSVATIPTRLATKILRTQEENTKLENPKEYMQKKQSAPQTTLQIEQILLLFIYLKLLEQFINRKLIRNFCWATNTNSLFSHESAQEKASATGSADQGSVYWSGKVDMHPPTYRDLSKATIPSPTQGQDNDDQGSVSSSGTVDTNLLAMWICRDLPMAMMLHPTQWQDNDDQGSVSSSGIVDTDSLNMWHFPNLQKATILYPNQWQDNDDQRRVFSSVTVYTNPLYDVLSDDLRPVCSGVALLAGAAQGTKPKRRFTDVLCSTK